MKVEVHELELSDLMRMLGGEEENLDELTRVVVFNGPPGCGKDYFCNTITGKHDVRVMRFSAVLKTLVADAANVSMADITTKQDKIEYLGKTLRQHQIELFHFLAAQFGEDILGRYLYAMIHHVVTAEQGSGPLPLIVTPDGGRGPEVQYIADMFGTDNVMIVQVERDGYTFDGDIRNYVNIEGVHTVRIKNEDGDKYIQDVKDAINAWIRDWAARNEAKIKKHGMTYYDRETK